MQLASLTAPGRPVTLRRYLSWSRFPRKAGIHLPRNAPIPTEMDVTVTDSKTQNGMAAEAYIARLGERGIEYVFANAGTDFAPIVEALSRNRAARRSRAS